MNFNTPTLIGALLAVACGAFSLGRISSSSGTVEDGSATMPLATRAARESGTAGMQERDDRKPRSATREPETREQRLSRLESIIRGENPLDRNRALLAFINQLAPGDFEDAVAHFRSLGLTDERMGDYSLLLTAWAAEDPFKALSYARENTNGAFATDTILTAWAGADPEAAIRWAQANFTGDGANPYLPGVIRGIAESDPARATELLTSMPRSVERRKGLDAFLPHLIRQGNQAAYSWIASLKDEALKRGAVERAAEPLAEKDPVGTIAWLTSSPSEDAYRRVDNVFSTYARKEPQAALQSFQALPPGRDRTNALAGIVGATASKNPKAGVDLMDRYPADLSDRVVQQFIWNSFEKDTSSAMSQVARITDQGQRERMYRRGMQAWIDRDAQAAQAWMMSNPLPPGILQDLNGGNSGN